MARFVPTQTVSAPFANSLRSCKTRSGLVLLLVLFKVYQRPQQLGLLKMGGELQWPNLAIAEKLVGRRHGGFSRHGISPIELGEARTELEI
jgi:hypothetical protein